MMKPHYYLMKSKKILRLEAENSFSSLPLFVREKILIHDLCLNQDQANWRVALFRDEILEIDEYVEWLSCPEALEEEEFDYELTAN